MKRILFSASVAALMLNVTSCQNEEIIEKQEGQMVTLQATFGTGTRTTLEENGTGYATKWSAGDQIYVTDDYGFVSGVLTLVEGEGQNSGTFSGVVTGNPAALSYAVFPVPTNGKIGLNTADASQTDAPMSASINGLKANFKNECGLVKLKIFNLPENADVRLSAKGIAGDLQVNAQNGVTFSQAAADEIVIENVKSGQEFFVPVWAGDQPVATEFTLTIGKIKTTFTANIQKGSVSVNGVPELYYSDKGIIDWDDYVPAVDPNNQDNYFIKDATDLIWISEQVNKKHKDFKGQTLTITDDVDLKEVKWTPIGDSKENYFNGTFDGANKSIKNLTVDNGTKNNAGLFGYVQGSKTSKIEIKNVVLENVSVKGGWRTGGLIGNCGNYASISNITVKGLVKIEGYSDVAAVVGGNCRTISNITVNVENGSYVQSTVGTVGGVAGLLQENNHANDITSNINVIATSVEKANNPGVGGIFGCTNGDNKLTNCSSSGNVTIQNASTTELAQKIGGISGGKQFGKLTLTGCSYTGKLASSYNGTPIATFNNNSLVGGKQDKNIIIK